MIGTKLTGPPVHPVATYSWPIAAFVLIGIAAVVKSWLPAMLAVGPFVIFVTTFNRFRKPFECEVGEEGLHFKPFKHSILYSSIVKLEYVPTEKNPDSAIVVSQHNGGTLIPANALSNVDSGKLIEFLLSQMLIETVEDIPESLQEFYDDQVDRHGTSAVLLVISTDTPGKKPRRTILMAFVRGLVISGLLYGIGFAVNVLMLVPALICFFLAPMTWWTCRSRTKKLRVVKNAYHSCIIMSPDGLGILQGSSREFIEWSQVDEITLAHTAVSLDLTNYMEGTVCLTVGDSITMVRDIYQLPIYSVFRIMMRTWENQMSAES